MRYVLMLVLLLGLGAVDSSAQTRMRLSKPASVYASGDLDPLSFTIILDAGTEVLAYSGARAAAGARRIAYRLPGAGDRWQYGYVDTGALTRVIPPPRRVGPVEGVFEYLTPLKGQAITVNGHYSYVFGPADGSGPVIANAGTYAVSRDTVTNQILWSTVPGNVGTSFRWTSTALRGDTMEWQLIDSAGTVVQRGRSVKVK